MWVKSSKIYVFLLTALVVSAALMWGIQTLGPKADFKAFPRGEQLLDGIHHGLEPELAKLLFVLESFRDSHALVILDGTEYDINSTLAQARLYLQRNYQGETAETWIKTNLSSSPTGGETIILKFSDGRERPLSEVLLDKLRRLPPKKEGPAF